jgi:hypothetical protein
VIWLHKRSNYVLRLIAPHLALDASIRNYTVRNAGLTPMISIVVLSQVKSLKDQPYTIRMRDNLKNLSDEPCAGTGLRMVVRSVFHI